jgi:hypothetical protein
MSQKPNDCTLRTFGKALGPLMRIALEPFKQERPGEYATVMAALAWGDFRLRLVNVPGKIIVSALDNHGDELVLASLSLCLRA